MEKWIYYRCTSKIFFSDFLFEFILSNQGDSQATEPESNYFYKKWLDMKFSLDASCGHRIKQENSYKYEEMKLTVAVITKYIDDLLQKTSFMCVCFR